jgi:phosphomannomutase
MIGSPYVVKAMNDKLAAQPAAKVVSWESNGGFLLGSDWQRADWKAPMKALPTRDAVLPLVSALMLAKEQGKSMSQLIATSLPARYNTAGVVDNHTPGCETYTTEMGRDVVKLFSPANTAIAQVEFTPAGEQVVNVEGRKEPAAPEVAAQMAAIRDRLAKYFNAAKGFGQIVSINFVDGIRMTFQNNDIAHIRPSGNAPEFRFYSTSDTEERADQIVNMRADIFREIVRDMSASRAAVTPGVRAVRTRPAENTPQERIVKAMEQGIPLIVRPYEEPKVWGVNGIGEYWYGAEAAPKSSTASVGADKAPMATSWKTISGKRNAA